MQKVKSLLDKYLTQIFIIIIMFMIFFPLFIQVILNGKLGN